MKINKTFKIKFSNDNFGYLDAFGLEETHEFSPFKGLELPDSPPDITFVCGESGSGKTQLCNILADKWNFVRPSIPKQDLICCELIGSDKNSVDECIYYLNYVGLNDARLYYTKYRHLSDSQRFRAVIANTLLKNQGKGVYIDEFLSTLDRNTAKSIAFLIQKVARAKKIKLLLATAHSDLCEYVNPDLILKGKAFPERFIISNKCEPKTVEYTIRKCKKSDYSSNRLGELHYKGKYAGGAKEFFVAELVGDNSKLRNLESNQIGFLVSAVVGGIKLNQRRIARVVVHPSYRGIGVGTKLVKEFIKYARLNNVTKVSAVSAVGMFNPFFLRAGMDREDDYIVEANVDLIKYLKRYDFDFQKWFSKAYCIEFCKNQEMRKIVSKIATPTNRLSSELDLNISRIKELALKDKLHAGRYLWTLRPKVLSKYIVEF
jgi:ABC-type lipoprotein export system ATPase subunit/GNAT superfamily N-acetyltransferase